MGFLLMEHPGVQRWPERKRGVVMGELSQAPGRRGDARETGQNMAEFDVLQAFLERRSAENPSLSTDGNQLFSDGVLVADWAGGQVRMAEHPTVARFNHALAQMIEWRNQREKVLHMLKWGDLAASFLRDWRSMDRPTVRPIATRPAEVRPLKRFPARKADNREPETALAGV